MTPEKEIEIIRWMKDNYPTFETNTTQIWQMARMLNDYHESEVKKLRLSAVSGQSELLIAFADWVFNQPKHLGGRERELVAEYLKAINCH